MTCQAQFPDWIEPKTPAEWEAARNDLERTGYEFSSHYESYEMYRNPETRKLVALVLPAGM